MSSMAAIYPLFVKYVSSGYAFYKKKRLLSKLFIGLNRNFWSDSRASYFATASFLSFVFSVSCIRHLPSKRTPSSITITGAWMFPNTFPGAWISILLLAMMFPLNSPLMTIWPVWTSDWIKAAWPTMRVPSVRIYPLKRPSIRTVPVKLSLPSNSVFFPRKAFISSLFFIGIPPRE